MFQNFLNKRSLFVGRSIVRMYSMSKYSYETLVVTSPQSYVYKVELNNPEKKNAMKLKFWKELRECMETINEDGDCRCVVLSGAGSTFSAGIDLAEFGSILTTMTSEDVARRAFILRRLILSFQASFTSLEKCLKPVIAAVHGACIGGAVDMICAADIRMASQDAWFQVKEVAIGLAADVGTLQRLPKLVGSDSLARELVYTARKMESDEALKCGFVSKVFSSKESLLEESLKMAGIIAEMSPVAVQASKAALIYSKDHSVNEGLCMQADWNQVMLQSEDLIKAVMAAMQKQKPQFAKL